MHGLLLKINAEEERVVFALRLIDMDEDDDYYEESGEDDFMKFM